GLAASGTPDLRRTHAGEGIRTVEHVGEPDTGTARPVPRSLTAGGDGEEVKPANHLGGKGSGRNRDGGQCFVACDVGTGSPRGYDGRRTRQLLTRLRVA